MKKKRLYFSLFVAIAFMLSLGSCTDNQRARSWGGTEHVTVKKNEVVMNVTWKGDQLWICTKDTTTGVVYFREKSSWGVVQGEIILK
mgnify:CR=1 FL=1